ncbi:MAG: peptidase S46 [Bacteroidetes bacterium GWC2_33_15]|nr:MAG: peptidase S46 [Bacteroidetes bacterium GWA2_33_15]OFX49410.1 MAG: peptidase S46 [Bacteroidetes bacterium GWC2_33_15]OFX62997.1 MAG: peptidase S46 [Bacteroidetes bacterium GWB2_32_14]OFX68758.1 MAG: peptidase S46 [Bacteroidetes bacterium GWD2_33_33]HAN19067.1 serine protease [Bacteroidales bacterium]
MKKTTIIFLGFALMFNITLKADEGMWLLPLIQKLNIQKMQEMGFQLSAEDIYNVNNASMKDAVVIFGRGCTGEVISDQGLVLTNHHCGYGSIQQHSTPAHDYLKDGFWAMSTKEEIPTPGLTVTFLVRMEDVTEKINSVLSPEMTEPERQKAAEIQGKKIANDATEGTHYNAKVQSFFGGNQYFLIVNETFTDVRMVGAPPSSIGKFGADTDNWMWPRHTGDFSIFRIYAGKDNKPAEYSTENVPYKPKHHLAVSLKGIQKDDFAMILGYPGSTERYMTSWEVDELMKITNKNRIFIRGIRQEIILEDMLADAAIRIKYSSKYARSSNYWKNSIGMNKALKRLKIYDKKKMNETLFTEWVNTTPERKAKYGETLNLISNSINSRKDYEHVTQYISETLLRGTELISIALDAFALEESLKSGKKEDVDQEIKKLRTKAHDFYKDYNVPTDQKVARAMFKIFAENVDKKYQPDIFKTIETIYNNDFNRFVDVMFSKSIFTDSVKLYSFLENPSAKILDEDLGFIAAKSISKTNTDLKKTLEQYNADFDKGHRLYVAGVKEMNERKALYPDANFTMRLTYGKVADYYPMDAVHYDYITTLDGVMEKEDPDNWEFVVEEKLKEIYAKKDFGRYALANGKMPVAFISTNDITGGNSGSPVINAKGELIGTAFDGNWEAMSGDIVFEPELQRTINVDIRYTLFIIDKFAGCTRLIDEMTIVE